MCHVPIKTRCLATGSDERQEIELPEVLRLAQKRKKTIFSVKKNLKSGSGCLSQPWLSTVRTTDLIFQIWL